MKQGIKTNFFLFADEGFPPYGTTIVSTQKLVSEKPDLTARFVKASIEGWKSYLADPAAANELIKKDNPKMEDEQIAFAIRRMKELKVFDGGDAAKLGAGVMTEARWKQTYEFMVKAGLLQARDRMAQGVHNAVRQRSQDHALRREGKHHARHPPTGLEKILVCPDANASPRSGPQALHAAG